MNVTSSIAIACAFVALLAPGLASAEEPSIPVESVDEPALRPERPALRFDVVGAPLYVHYNRSGAMPADEDALGVGGELRIHPSSASGLLLGFQTGSAIFGPSVTALDAAYSFQAFAPKTLRGIHPSLYFDAGPSFGFVSVGNVTHHDVGGRLGVSLDVEVSHFVFGLEGVIHGGVPTDAPSEWESSFSAGLRLGLVFDVARRGGRAWGIAPGDAQVASRE